MKFIESPANTTFKFFKSLLSSRGINKEERFLVFGNKFIQETINAHPATCESIILKPGSKENPTDYPFLPGQVMKYAMPPDLYQELDLFGTREDILVCKTPEIPKWSPQDSPKGLELLLPLGDPSNLGAVLRTALAFNVSKIILLQESANPFHPKTSRAAAGTLLRLPLYKGPSIRHLSGVTNLFALDGKGQDIVEFPWQKDIRLLIGEEGPGIPDYIPKNQRLRIPINPDCESLNAGVAAGIALYAYPF